MADDPLGHHREQRLEVVEVLEDGADRDTGPLGDARRGRLEHALVDEADAGVDDGLPGAQGPRRPPVDGRGLRLLPCGHACLPFCVAEL